MSKISQKFAKFGEKLGQLRVAFSQTRAVDPKLVPILAGVAGGVIVVFVAIGLLLGTPLLFASLGIMFALTISLVIFGRRAQRAAITQIEGQPGAAAAVLQQMRGAWMVTPAVQVTRKQEFVHRVVGRPGVIVVGEGQSQRVTALLKQERRRIGRVVGETPVHEVRVGNRDGEVPLGKLQTHIQKLPRAMKSKQVGPMNRRLSALGEERLPMPKGPMPKPPGKKYR